MPMTRAVAFVGVWLAAAVQPVARADTGADQQQLEAAYLYKFGNYVTWPDRSFEAANSPIVIGVVDASRVAEDLTSLVNGRTVADRPVVVRHVHADDDLAGVHILFIGEADAAQAAALFEAARGRPILVVTEGDNGLKLGGALSFVVVDNHVRFDVSLDAVQRNGLKLSSLLLSVAHSVSEARQ